MGFLRYVYVLALVVWLGGMIMAGAVVAPATFGILAARAPDNGRVLAGAVFGEVLRRFQMVSYGSAAALLLSLILMALIGPRPAAVPLRASIIAAMLGIALYSGLGPGRRIEQIQRELGATPVVSLAPEDARRVEFGRLHGLSTALMLVNVIGGLVLLTWEARQ